jgi:hypothetical protein
MATTKSKKKRNEMQLNPIERAGSAVAQIPFFLLLILHPLYMDSQMYLALINAKGQCYIAISVITAIAMAAFGIYYLCNYKSYKKTTGNLFASKDGHRLDIAVLIFAACVWISWFLSSDPVACMFGTNGFHVGTYTILTMTIIYFFLSRRLLAGRKMWDMVFIVADIIFVWCFLNAMSVDILNMHAMILERQQFDYMASLGNVDSAAAYLCLLVPVGMIFYANADKSDRIFYGVFVTLGFLAIFSIQTDGIYFGLALACLFLFPYLFGNRTRLERLFDMGIMVGADLTLLFVLKHTMASRMDNDGAGITNWVALHGVGIVLLMVCGVVRFLLHKSAQNVHDKALKAGAYTTTGLDLLAILGYVVYTIRTFSPSWGTNRGDIWMGSVQMFSEYSVREKLFGVGMDMIRERLTSIVAWDQGVATCHNNILECLLCFGIIGLLVYLFLCANVVAPWFTKARQNWSDERVAYFVALVAYFGQSIVGNPYSLSVPIALLMLGLYRNQMRNENE